MCVLLVEDEDLIREIMVEGLQLADYDVIEAANSTMALDIICKLPDPPSMLITDFHMPDGINGFELATQVRTIWPWLPVVIVSGRPEVFRSAWQHDHDYQLIKKPYLPSDLIQVVKSLASPRRSSVRTVMDLLIVARYDTAFCPSTR